MNNDTKPEDLWSLRTYIGAPTGTSKANGHGQDPAVYRVTAHADADASSRRAEGADQQDAIHTQ
jgi:hypothetical protein